MVQIRPRRENEAKYEIERMFNSFTYAPLFYSFTKVRHAHRKVVMSSAPLYPGYVFVYDSGDFDWFKIYLVDAVVKVFSQDGVPLRIRPADMVIVSEVEKSILDSLKGKSGPGDSIRVGAQIKFKPGDHIYSDKTGICISKGVIEIFGLGVRVTLKMNDSVKYDLI